jgi:hypothetical protein
LKPAGNAGIKPAWEDRILFADHPDLLVKCVGAKRKSSGQQFIENDTERKDIASGIEWRVRARLLRREVARCSHDSALPGQTFPVTDIESQAEVQQPWFEIRPHENISRLKIAMDHLILVKKLDGHHNLVHQLRFLAQRERLAGLRERHSVHVLHHEVGNFTGLTEVVDPDDIGMTQLCHRTGFLHETRPQFRIAEVA